MVRSLKLPAAADLNRNSHGVELVIQDDNSLSRNAVSAYRKLRASGIQAIIGATWGFTTEPIVPLLTDDKTVLVNTSTFAEVFRHGDENQSFFSMGLSIEEDTLPFKRFLARSSFSSVMFIHTSSKWGTIQERAYRATARKNSLEVFESIEPTGQDLNLWRTIVSRIKTKAPSVVVLLLNEHDIENILRRVYEQGVAPF